MADVAMATGTHLLRSSAISACFRCISSCAVLNRLEMLVLSIVFS